MGPQLQRCTYLRACLDETMRLSPAVGGVLPREVLKGGLAIPGLGLQLPAGVEVGVPIYALHHHREFVVEPFRFEPARWLTAEEETESQASSEIKTSSPFPHAQDRAALHAIFTPFGIGHRACLGKPLVYLELSIAIARLLWEFELRLAPQTQQVVSPEIARDLRAGRRVAGEYHLLDWFMSRNEGPVVEFRRRRTRREG